MAWSLPKNRLMPISDNLHLQFKTLSERYGRYPDPLFNHRTGEGPRFSQFPVHKIVVCPLLLPDAMSTIAVFEADQGSR